MLGLALQGSKQQLSLMPSMLAEAPVHYSPKTSAMDELAAVERLHARTTKLELPCCDKKFEPAKIYPDSKELDLDHPNR
jgi:hypothetical protein